MKKFRKGFTLIEVSLFLVITGALFISVTVGVQNSIYQQRFNDSVQNFAEFLRTIYAETLNVEGIGGGRSDKAIYGKLITFGETTDLTGSSVPKSQKRNTIFAYDVVGNIKDAGTGNILDILNDLNANIIIVEDGMVKPTGIIENYVPRWAAEIEPPCSGRNCSYTPFVGAVLIVRHPNSGVVYTYSMIGRTIEVNSLIKGVQDSYAAATTARDQATTEKQKAEAEKTLSEISKGMYKNILKSYLVPNNPSDPHFTIQDVNFCVNPTPGEANIMRRNVRILAGARNASGVEVVTNEADNKCVVQE